MSDRVGLIIASEAGSMERDQIYDSRKPKLTLDPKPNPPHFDVLQNFSAGSKWTMPDAAGVNEEVLFKVKHGLPFKPMYAAFFYPTSVPAARKSNSPSQYSINLALMLYNAFGLGEESLYADADETYFYIKHKAERFGGGDGTSYTFYGSDFQYRIRYMIFNQPSFLIDGGVVPQ